MLQVCLNPGLNTGLKDTMAASAMAANPLHSAESLSGAEAVRSTPSTGRLSAGMLSESVLAGAVHQAQERAHQGHGLVLSIVFSLPAVPSSQAQLCVAERLRESPPPWFYWESPTQETTWIAQGCARWLRAEGPRRFLRITESYRRLCRNSLSLCCTGVSPGQGRATRSTQADPPQGPLLVGGFSFFDTLDSTEWPGFAPALFLLPEMALLRRAGNSWGVLQAWVHKRSAAPPLVRRLWQQTERLQEWNRSPGSPLSPVVQPLTRLSAQAGAPLQSTQLRPREAWLEDLREAQRRIHAGELSKLVLARAQDLRGSDPIDALKVLHALHTHRQCYRFLFRPTPAACFLGATPERLAHLHGHTAYCEALAGSAPRGKDAEADRVLGVELLQHPKELQEHAIVAQGIAHALRGLGGLQQPAHPTLLRLAHVQHLHTPMQLHTRRHISLLALLRRLHPTPAVGGWPQKEALQWIAAHEPFARGWYAAPIGWLDHTEGEFAVALRSALLQGPCARIFAGCGIVAASRTKHEYAETELKFRTMLEALCAEGSNTLAVPRTSEAL